MSIVKNNGSDEGDNVISREIYDSLKDGIIRNTIPQGTPLTVRSLAEKWNVSSTPVRDALILLEADGWIRSNGRLRVVSIPGDRELLELSQIRLELELLAYRLAKPSIDPNTINALYDIFELAKKYDRDWDGVNYMIISTRYHHYLSTICGNEKLSLSLLDMLQKLNRYSLDRFKKSKLSRDFTLSEHEQLIHLLAQERWDDYVIMLTRHIKFWPDFSEISQPERGSGSE